MEQNQNSGLQGLGNLNTDNASATIATPYGYLNKNDVDDRKIALDVSKFRSTQEFRDYLFKWFSNTGLVEVQQAFDTDTQMYNGMPMFRLSMVVNNMMQEQYLIFTVLNQTEAVGTVDAILAQGATQGVVQGTTDKKVIIGYFNNDQALKRRVNNTGIELFDFNCIYDINAAIDSANKKLPYFNVDSSKLSSRIAKALNKKYASSATGKLVDTDQMKGSLNGLGGSFSEGLGQLKESLTGALFGLGLNKKQQAFGVQGQVQGQGQQAVGMQGQGQQAFDTQGQGFGIQGQGFGTQEQVQGQDFGTQEQQMFDATQQNNIQQNNMNE